MSDIKLNVIPQSYHTAIEASIEASKVLMEYYKGEINIQFKKDGSPVTLADIASSKVILKTLATTNIPIVGEESHKEDYQTRKNWDLNWCVDPLDGTKEFIKQNDEFGICIALIQNNNPIFGVIASPTEQKVIFGGKDLGVYISTFSSFSVKESWCKVEAASKVNTPLVVIGSRSFSNNEYEKLVDELHKKYEGVSYFQKGSALKFFDLALNKADIYPRFAPTMEWDIAAGHAILNELGGEVLNVETGLPLVYNKENLVNPFFIAKTKAIKSN